VESAEGKIHHRDSESPRNPEKPEEEATIGLRDPISNLRVLGASVVNFVCSVPSLSSSAPFCRRGSVHDRALLDIAGKVVDLRSAPVQHFG
jgi:hypothetical protein